MNEIVKNVLKMLYFGKILRFYFLFVCDRGKACVSNESASLSAINVTFVYKI